MTWCCPAQPESRKLLDDSDYEQDTNLKEKNENEGSDIEVIRRGNLTETIFDTARLIFSLVLLSFCIFSVFYAVSLESTIMEDDFGDAWWLSYPLLVVTLFMLGILEGSIVGVSKMAGRDPEPLRAKHPRAAELVEIMNTGRNVERYFVGRQVLVVLAMFVAARVTTFDEWLVEVPDGVKHGIFYSGSMGVMIVATIGQLVPQISASAFPVQFISIPGLKYVFYGCLALEFTGICHSVWFFVSGIKNLLEHYIYADDDKHLDLDDDQDQVPHGSSLKMVNVPVLTDDDDDDDDEKVEEEKEQTQARLVGQDYEQGIEEFIGNFSNANQSPEIIFSGQAGKHPTIEEFQQKLIDNEIPIPRFLFPRKEAGDDEDNEEIVPPHILSLTILRMYRALQQKHQKLLSEKALQSEN
jgi:hypothetical protein